MARVFGYRVNKGVYLQRLNGEILIVRKSYANYMWQTVVPLIFFFFFLFFFFSFFSNVLISICSFLLLLFFSLSLVWNNLLFIRFNGRVTRRFLSRHTLRLCFTCLYLVFARRIVSFFAPLPSYRFVGCSIFFFIFSLLIFFFFLEHKVKSRTR